jgi:hypothetical protein
LSSVEFTITVECDGSCRVDLLHAALSAGVRDAIQAYNQSDPPRNPNRAPTEWPDGSVSFDPSASLDDDGNQMPPHATNWTISDPPTPEPES